MNIQLEYCLFDVYFCTIKIDTPPLLQAVACARPRLRLYIVQQYTLNLLPFSPLLPLS